MCISLSNTKSGSRHIFIIQYRFVCVKAESLEPEGGEGVKKSYFLRTYFMDGPLGYQSPNDFNTRFDAECKNTARLANENARTREQKEMANKRYKKIAERGETLAPARRHAAKDSVADMERRNITR